MIKLSDYVFDFLARERVKRVFLLSGGGCMHLVDSLGRNADLEYVCCLHEQAAAVSASASALYRNDLGVALVTTGPGGTNAITGALGAWIDSVPLLVISGQVKRADMQGNSGLRILGYQEADIISMVKPITKYAASVMKPERIRAHLEEAVYWARSGRPGPVWLDIPLDVQASPVDPGCLAGYTPPSPAKPPAREQISAIWELLGTAARPVLMVGKGVAYAHAEDLLERFRSSVPIPTLTTWRAMDLVPDEDDHYFGRPGCIGQRAANFIQQNADLILTIGARLDFGQIGFNHDAFARGARKIFVDVDPSELAKFNCPIDIPLCADARAALQALLDTLPTDMPGPWVAWQQRCKAWRERYPVVLQRHHNEEGFVNLYALVDVLSASMTPQDIFVPGSSGACIDVPMQAFRLKRGQRFIAFPGIGAMGFGIPTTLGACLASGRRRTICTNGDGGFQLNLQELETVVRLNLPIKYFVLNNGAYGSIKATQRNYFDGRYVASDPGSGVTLPAILRIADAYGIPVFRLSSNAELATVIPQVLAGPGPALCEVEVNPEAGTEFKVSSVIKEDGAMVSRPQEDLWPFLPRAEFNSNMIVEPLPE